MSYREPTAEQLALREEIKAQYPYLIDRATYGKKISGAALGAKNIKRLLTREFPGVKFSASCDAYSSGVTIVVSWPGYDEAPSSKQVDALIHDNFASLRYDGRDESTDFDNDPWRTQFRALFGSGSYVRAQASYISPEDKAALQTSRLEANTAPVAAPRRGPRL